MTPGEETAQGLFLWLAPGEPEGASLGRVILALSERLGTTPFDAHVTLLGPLGPPEDEALEESAELARRVAPLALPLRGVNGEDSYYRALFAAVEPTPALLAARQAALALLPGPEAAFRPHLSLAYGWLEATVQVALSIELVPRLPVAVRASHLDLIRTDGPVRAWRRLRRFDLTGAPS
jgi:2'-5' RNA ligase superfamily